MCTVACVKIFFLFKAQHYCVVCVCHIVPIHSSIDRHLSYYYPSAIVSNAPINIGVQISL